ncbi:MAG TPA: class I SAM-dependent methyltransferase [Accumulibacter sp.]|uniref:class I SAM-dependent methyltransferase n=1 Tax=Accumulibacter sp. TaxID=2053492 RepID=UPI0028789E93|nr:class I SAM-dependent methyltransferase [Accumulibacter sp.]MDS4055450.1 class I SAM-dependent methyltransferase [Accumulibacter sp.]HMV05714.1 class I SAM-dependent methyltransferase [Accumulibacter sp.]HMW63954.1 class I SAM-dependent methyltransferase [Accumulibacter sp.]HMW80757.1 class I SAM-dependent methyltransferase [Accumulibacter sp.]HNB66571.1 class I SAM-dependent methyltransferase [Accumulibacter sp.]
MTISLRQTLPSAWVQRFARLIPSGEVLDLACGSGRHARLLAAYGHRVEAVDRDPQALAELRQVPGVTPRQSDLEGPVWPYTGRLFSGIVVTNYLFRPRIDQLFACLADPGVLIYETFMHGNERYGRPSNPDFLLASQELLGWAQRRAWRVVAYEEGYRDDPAPAVVQSLCAARGAIDA